MLFSLLPERSLYSRSSMFILLGTDILVWVIVHAGFQTYSEIMLPDVFWVVSVLLWIATTGLITGYSPYSVKKSRQVYLTSLIALVHSISLVLIFLIAGWQGLTTLFLYVSLGFYILRAVILLLLYRIYSYWKTCTNNAIRFITVGKAYAHQVLAEHLVRDGAMWLEHISLEREPEELVDKIQKIYRTQRITHIYYTSLASDYSLSMDLLWRWADRHYIYLHWVPISQFDSEEYRRLNIQLVSI